MSPNSRRYLKILLQTAVLLLCVGVLIQKLDLQSPQGRSRFLQVFTSGDAKAILLSFFVGEVAILVSVWRWRALLAGVGMQETFARLCALTYVGRFVSTLLPGSIGGDVVRIYELSKSTSQGARVSASVIAERAVGLLVLLCLTAGSILGNAGGMELPNLMPTFLFSAAFAAVVGWLLFDLRWTDPVSRWLARWTPWKSGLTGPMSSLKEALLAYRRSPNLLALTLFQCFLFYALTGLAVAYAMEAFYPQVPHARILSVVPIVLFVGNLPVSLGGLGVSEVAYTVLFAKLGVPAEAALSAAFIVRGRALGEAALGAVLYGRVRKGRPSPNSASGR